MVKKEQFTHIDLFCGAGGLGLGFKKAGFKTLLAVDNNKDAVKTYNLNVDNVAVCGFIENIDYKYIEDVDIITAGFPCQPFSTAGKREGFEDDRSNYYVKLFDIFKLYNPKFIMMENVKGFTNHNKGMSLQRVVNDLKDIGYNVQFRVLNSWFYEVPQIRERVIIMATKEDLKISYQYPDDTTIRLNVGDVIKDCTKDLGYKWTEYKQNIYKDIEEGSVIDGKYYRRLHRNKPSWTITTTPVGKITSRCHPTENRPISIQESQVIQTFPKDFEFVGSISSQYKQIGNAVPVNFAYHLAKSVIKYLEELETVDGIDISF